MSKIQYSVDTPPTLHISVDTNWNVGVSIISGKGNQMRVDNLVDSRLLKPEEFDYINWKDGLVTGGIHSRDNSSYDKIIGTYRFFNKKGKENLIVYFRLPVGTGRRHFYASNHYVHYKVTINLFNELIFQNKDSLIHLVKGIPIQVKGKNGWNCIFEELIRYRQREFPNRKTTRYYYHSEAQVMRYFRGDWRPHIDKNKLFRQRSGTTFWFEVWHDYDRKYV
tara:strand:+ start:3571 stop:4236 length:666 start_codon:yes stop_codon:yes gene_type:complete